MTTPGETDTAYGEVHARVERSIVVLGDVGLVEGTVQQRQTICRICAEGVDQVLRAVEEVVAGTVEVAVGISAVEQVAPVDVGIVVGCRALQGEDALRAVVEGGLGDVAEILEQAVLTALDDGVGVVLHVFPRAGEGADLSHNGLSGGACDASYRALLCGQHVDSLAQVALDELEDLVACVLGVSLRVDVLALGEVRNALEDADEVEVVPGAQGFQLAHELVGGREAAGLLKREHSVVYAADGIVVVLPFVQAADVVAIDLADLEQVDVLLHTRAATTFVGVVRADIEDPVGRGACKGLVVAVEVSLEAGVG